MNVPDMPLVRDPWKRMDQLNQEREDNQVLLQANTLGFAEALHEVGLLPAERLAYVSNLLKPKAG